MVTSFCEYQTAGLSPNFAPEALFGFKTAIPVLNIAKNPLKGKKMRRPE
jgi:hypothetical protein